MTEVKGQEEPGLSTKGYLEQMSLEETVKFLYTYIIKRQWSYRPSQGFFLHERKGERGLESMKV